MLTKLVERPSRLYFVGYEDATEMTLTEDDPVLLQCAASRVLPLPHLKISLRNHSVSDNLTPNATVNVHCRDPDCGPVHHDLDALLTVPRLQVQHGDDGQDITCSAKLPHSNWTPSITSLRLNVRCKRCQCCLINCWLVHDINMLYFIFTDKYFTECRMDFERCRLNVYFQCSIVLLTCAKNI